MINRVFPPTRGATGRLLLELSSALSAQGYDVTVLTTGDKPSTRRDLYGIEIIRVKSPRNPRSFTGNILLSMRLFLKALLLPRYDIIVSKTDPPFFVFFASLLSYLKFSKHIHWCQDLYPNILPAIDYKISNFTYRFIDWFNIFGMKNANRVVAIGSCMRHQILKKGLLPSKVVVIPNWLDGVLLKDGEILKKNQDLPAKFRVLYAGHMGVAHPYETILEAAEVLNENDQDIEILLVGNAPQLHKLAKERSRRGLDNLRFLPYQPRRRLRNMLESGDIHLVSMSDEAVGCMLPSRIYDTLAVQRPCIFIGPESSDISIMLEKYEAGVTIPHGHGEMLANAIRHFRDHGEDWNILYQGSANAAKDYTPEHSLELWNKVLREL